MEVLRAIRERRSVRQFRSDKIPERDLTIILDAARWAPSAGNLQPWVFVVVEKEQLKKEISRAAYDQDFISTAPVVIVVCADVKRSSSVYGERGRSLYCIQDTAAATQNILLAAHALGYATCWVGAFKENEVKRLLRLPEDVRPVAIVPVGVAAYRAAAPARLPLEEIVHKDTY